MAGRSAPDAPEDQGRRPGDECPLLSGNWRIANARYWPPADKGPGKDGGRGWAKKRDSLKSPGVDALHRPG
jgi:hypothetical protein